MLPYYMVNIFVNILRMSRQILLPVIVMLCLVGVYSVNSSLLDLLIMGLFGLVGFTLKCVGFHPAPLILAMVISPMLENSLRQALLISGGNLGELV
jgi:putative tricarboxylic transport membrane protein